MGSGTILLKIYSVFQIIHYIREIHMITNPEKLFSYGTLRYESVQLATFGRKLAGCSDSLSGYELTMVKITDKNVIEASGEAEHPIITFTGNASNIINGFVFDITTEELVLADSYEVADYKRICVKLVSGIKAWVYVNKAKL